MANTTQREGTTHQADNGEELLVTFLDRKRDAERAPIVRVEYLPASQAHTAPDDIAWPKAVTRHAQRGA